MNFLRRKYELCLSECLRHSALGFALLLPASAFAEALPSESASVTAVPPPIETQQQSGFMDPIIDLPREYVSGKFVNFISSVDRFFGSNINFQESNKSVIQLDEMVTADHNGVSNVVTSFRAKIHLPNVQMHLKQLQNQIHLLLESNPDRVQSQSVAGSTAGPQTQAPIFREVSTPNSYGVSLRFENDDASLWRLSADGGLKLDNISLRPFVRSRASFAVQAGQTQLKLAESLFWYDTIGAGENTQFDADYRVSESLLFRATSGATWLHDTQNFDLRQDFSYFQTLNENASRLYQASVIGVSQPQTQVSEYVILMLHRQRIHRDWIFLELSPQLHYPRLNNYQLDAQFIVRMEVLFSK